MQRTLVALTVGLVSALAGVSALAKLPAPVLTDAAKAKAAETAAKTAWSGKLDAYQLCRAQERAAAHWRWLALSSSRASAPMSELRMAL